MRTTIVDQVNKEVKLKDSNMKAFLTVVLVVKMIVLVVGWALIAFDKPLKIE